VVLDICGTKGGVSPGATVTALGRVRGQSFRLSSYRQSRECGRVGGRRPRTGAVVPDFWAPIILPKGICSAFGHLKQCHIEMFCTGNDWAVWSTLWDGWNRLALVVPSLQPIRLLLEHM